MSAKCSTSPSLRLTVGNSRARRVLHRLLCLLVVFTLYRLYEQGYPVAAIAFFPVAGLCCWQLARQPLAGANLCWRQGEWSIEYGTHSVPVTLRTGSTFLPWTIYVAWVEPVGGRRASAWLFPDSAPAEQLRRLRVRIALEC